MLLPIMPLVDQIYEADNHRSRPFNQVIPFQSGVQTVMDV